MFFYFAFQTYFIDDEVDEAGPVFASGAVQTTADAENPNTATATPARPGTTQQPSTSATPANTAPPADTAPAATPTPTQTAPDNSAATTASQSASAPSDITGDELSEELRAEMDEFMEQENMPNRSACRRSNARNAASTS